MTDWTKINDENKFRDLCNYLLKEELGWPFVSVAKGKDNLQDASFSGEYKNKEGSWIFQYKWLNILNGKQNNRNSFKSNLVGGSDPEAKRVVSAHNPDHYVVLTNIDLTLPQKLEITEKAKEQGLKDVAIWDQADLEVLLNLYPSALIRFFEQQLPIFEHFSQRFNVELNDESSPLYFGKESLFLGRENDILEIENIIADISKKIILLFGSGGVGKTRLLVELCKTIEAKDNTSRTYFIRGSSEIQIKDILAELPSADGGIKTLIIILDDSHVFSRELLFELGSIFRANSQINIKLILTTRPELKEQVLHQLPVKSDTIEITGYEIDNLNISDIGKLIKAKIKDIELSNQLIAWARRGRWSPMETNLIINEAIKSNSSFRGVVNESQIIERLFTKYLESYSDDAKTIIELIAFLQPFQYEDEELKKVVLEYLNWDEHKYIKALDELSTAPIIESLTWGIRRYKIQPDILADWLRDKACYTDQGNLTQSCKTLVKIFLPVSTEQFITNLAQTEFDKDEKILNDFFNEIETDVIKGNNFDRIQILKILKKIAWYRPLETLQILKRVIAKPGKDYTPEGLEWAKYDHLMVLAEIPPLLADIGYHLEYFSEVIDVMFKLATNESPSRNAHQNLMQISQIKYRRSLEFNLKVIDFLSKVESIGEEKIMTVIMEIIKKQFVTHIDYDYQDPESPKTFHWTSFPIKAVYSPQGFLQLQKLHSEGLDFLFKITSNKSPWFVRKLGIETLSSVAQALLFQSQPMRTTPLEDEEKYPIEPELGRIVDNIESCIEQELKRKVPDFRVLDAIIGFTGTFKRKKTNFDPRILEIKQAIKKNDEYNVYELLIAEHRDWDKDIEGQNKNHLDNPSVKRIFKRYKDTPSEFLIFLNTLLSLREGWVFGSVNKLASEIGEQNPELAEKFVDSIKNGEFSSLEIYAGYFIVGIRNKDSSLARSIVNRLTNESNIISQKIALNSYSKYWIASDANKKPIGILPDEIDHLERLKSTSNRELKLEIAKACAVFILLNKTKTLKLLEHISKSIEKDDFNLQEIITDTLSPRDNSFSKSDLPLLKKILLNFVPIADLDKTQMMQWHLEQIFEYILQFEPGFVIDFYELRIKHKNSLDKNQSYDAIPFRLEFPKIGENQNEEEMCRRIRNWVVENNWFRLEAPRFLKNFGFSLPVLGKVLEEWINNSESDPVKKHELIVLAAYLLRDFEDSEWLYDLLAKIMIKAGDYESDDEKYRDIIGEVVACIQSGSSWGDTKHQAIVTQLNRILARDDASFCSRVKQDLKKLIDRQQEEIAHMNDLLNGDWE